jgi:hypothetical protein
MEEALLCRVNEAVCHTYEGRVPPNGLLVDSVQNTGVCEFGDRRAERVSLSAVRGNSQRFEIESGRDRSICGFAQCLEQALACEIS